MSTHQPGQPVSPFVSAVAHYTKGAKHFSVGACPGCADCGLEDIESMDTPEYESADEPYFSWSACESCGSSLGGDRHPAHSVDPETDEILHWAVCTDCLFYHANGDEPEDWEG